jgi:hypothetical protein
MADRLLSYHEAHMGLTRPAAKAPFPEHAGLFILTRPSADGYVTVQARLAQCPAYVVV